MGDSEVTVLLVINYHYIRPDGAYPYPGIHPTTPEALEAQLLELGRHFEFIGMPALDRLIQEGAPLSKPLCLITLDDGLREQYENALPVFDQLGIPAVFFVSTMPLLDRRAATVHKIHWLRATRSPEQFLNQFLRALDSMGSTFNLDMVDGDASARQYLYDDPATRKLKFLLNHVIPPDISDVATDRLFSKEWDESEFCQEFYMSRDQVRRIAGKHAVGGHSNAHRPLTSLKGDSLRRDLMVSRLALEEITGEPVYSISYPYGGPTAVTWGVTTVARNTKYRIGFTTERSPNRSLQFPLLLARVSTNDALGGKSPLMSLDSSAFDFVHPARDRRSVYFSECEGKEASYEPGV